MDIKTLDEALLKIKELEQQIADLKSENEQLHENGMSIMEIVAEGDISRRTAYRYLAYYREMMNR